MGGRGSAGRSSSGGTATEPSIYDELAALSARERAATKAQTPTTVPSAEAQLRAAYDELAAPFGPNTWHKISDVRAHLAQRFPDVSPQLLDRAMHALSRRPDVDMMGEANQKTLTAKDRRNAVRVGGQDAHLIAIDKRRAR